MKHMTITECFQLRKLAGIILTDNTNTRHNSINDNLENCYSKIANLINAEISNGSKDYDLEYIRNHVEKLTS